MRCGLCGVGNATTRQCRFRPEDVGESPLWLQDNGVISALHYAMEGDGGISSVPTVSACGEETLGASSPPFIHRVALCLLIQQLWCPLFHVGPPPT